ncbi:MAG: TIGR03960 family B12-binding radical SAM protein [Chloroflexota bacterium]|nr:TIGR03960 family B12-binding radical SAM protein [Chloroflexota bacterium]
MSAINGLDRILPNVTRPARYTGGEWNSVVKDWDAIDVHVALIYPDTYEVGMSNMGLAILYDVVNRHPHFLAERAFAPWMDMEAEMRQAALPLFSLESRRPLGDFDVIGFSLGYELTYTNVLNMLDLAGIPLEASQRDASHPLIIAGGGCALNPAPMAAFIDLFVMGEGEEVLPELLEAVRRCKREGAGGRRELLRELAGIPGVYAPCLYNVEYNADGTVSSIEPASPGVAGTVQRRLLTKLPPAVTRPVVPFVEAIHDRAAIEIQRGCTRGCRFCQAGIIYRPVRERPRQEVVDAVDELLSSTGYSELSLLSLSTSDYSEIEGLVATLVGRYRDEYLRLSLPSLRMDSFSVALMDSLQSGKKTGLTFAPEAGNERLRQALNKGLSDEQVLQTLQTAAERGWGSVKLYFMLGLPSETLEDVDSIVHLARRMAGVGRRSGARPLHIRLSASPFVPKPHTPFQWVAQNTLEQLNEKIDLLRAGLKKKGVRLSWADPRMSLLEGVLARGDRRLSAVIHRAWELGCRFDCWSDRFDHERWLQAFHECGVDPAFYAHRERSLDEVLPWAHVDVGVTDAFLKGEYDKTQNGAATEDCRFGRCAVCGLERWPTACQNR